jgi:hypothetical protein
MDEGAHILATTGSEGAPKLSLYTLAAAAERAATQAALLKITSKDTVLALSTGTGPGESMFEIDLLGPGCTGVALPYGSGLAGSGGAVPALRAIGCPDINRPFTITIDQVLGTAVGVFAIAPAAASIPLLGGTLHVDPSNAFISPCIIPGPGGLALPVLLTAPMLIGAEFFLQAGFPDPGAVQGLSLTNGLRITIG